MSRGGVHTYVFIMHFWSDKWEPCHIIVGTFETTYTYGSAMALQMIKLLAKHI
jgi:hypothetical protein